MTEKKILISEHKNIKKVNSTRRPGWAFLHLDIKEIDFPHYDLGTYKVNKLMFYGKEDEIESGFAHYTDIKNKNEKLEITFDTKDLISIKKGSPPNNELKALEAEEETKSLTIDLVESENKIKNRVIEEEPEPIPRPNPNKEIKISFTVKNTEEVIEENSNDNAKHKTLVVKLEKLFVLSLGVHAGRERKSTITEIKFLGSKSEEKYYNLPTDSKNFELSFKNSDFFYYLDDISFRNDGQYSVCAWEGSNELLKVYNADDTDKITLKKTESPESKLKTIIKNLQEAIASGEKNQLVSAIAEGRKIEEESNSSQLNSLLEAAEKKLGATDSQALRTGMLSDISEKMAKNSVKKDQLSSEAQAAQQELETNTNLEPQRIGEIKQMVVNSIGEVALTSLISKIKQLLTSNSVSSEQKKKFCQELTQFQNSEAASYKKAAYQKNQATVDQLLEQLQEKKEKENTSNPFWRPKVLVPLALFSLLVILIIVVISSNRRRR